MSWMKKIRNLHELDEQRLNGWCCSPKNTEIQLIKES